MTWDELIAEFRDLGGISENVRVAEGPLGRGVFAIDSGKPAALFAPRSLLVPVDSLEVRNGQLETNSDEVGKRERVFFNNYQKHFGWGAGGFDEAWQAQASWNALPFAVVDFIKRMGALDRPELRFLPPSEDICSYFYVRNREFGFDGRLYLVPVVDLTNNASGAVGRVWNEGIGVRGIFETEVFLRYNISDAWAHTVSYGFSDRNPFAYSVEVEVAVREKQLRINRAFAQVDIRDGILFPRTDIAGNVVTLQQLMLGNSTMMDVPRAVFRKIMEPHLTTLEADDTLDGLLQFNRMKFLDLLRILERYESPLITVLKQGAINQLEALSSIVGARHL